MTDAQLISAMVSVCGAMRHRDAQSRRAEQRQVDVVRAFADRVRESYDEELESVKGRIEACLLPIEPLRQTWNVFKLFDIEYEEVRWTQWFAAILRPENGVRCARVAWGAFCEAIANRALNSPPVGADNPADHHHWRHVATEIPVVQAEVHDGDLGRLDLLITTPSIAAAVENKLWADWHDGSKAPQADRYREIAKKYLAGETKRRLGLVLLSQREGVKPGHYPKDYIHVSWRDVGQALRRRLKSEWIENDEVVLELWPLILTLISLEQDLLGFSLAPATKSKKSTLLKGLSELATYLEGR